MEIFYFYLQIFLHSILGICLALVTLLTMLGIYYSNKFQKWFIKLNIWLKFTTALSMGILQFILFFSLIYLSALLLRG